MIRIDIVMTTHEDVEILKKTLKTLDDTIDQKKYDVELMLVDNRSSKKCRDELLKNVWKYRIYHNFETWPIFMDKQESKIRCMNAGFSRSFGRKVTASYLVFLSDDVNLKEGWIEAAIERFSNNKKLEILSNSKNFVDFEASIFKFNSVKYFDENLLSYYEYGRRLANEKKDAFEYFIFAEKSKAAINENEIAADILQHKIFDSLDRSKKKVVYTFKDTISELPDVFRNDEYEYVCFTCSDEKFNGWKCFNIMNIARYLNIEGNDLKMKEYVKLNPHRFFKDKEESIFIDSRSMSRLNNIYTLKEDEIVFTLSSCRFKCTYRNLINSLKTEKISKEEFESILNILKWHHVPENIGVCNTDILIRKHMNERCIRSMERIWNLVNKFSYDDTLYFNACLWIEKLNYSYIPEKMFLDKFGKENK